MLIQYTFYLLFILYYILCFQNLQLEPSCVLEFEHNAENAFKCSSAGDKIFLFPGVYQCDTLGWFEGDITVEGIKIVFSY